MTRSQERKSSRVYVDFLCGLAVGFVLGACFISFLPAVLR